MSQSKFTTIGRKVLMALSGFFLMFFLLQHLTINMLSVVDPDTFNSVSHFMGYNPVIQFLMQPVLIFAVFFHFVMGMYLEYKNNKARSIKYSYNKPGENSNWMSRNMIYSGLVVLAFLGVHFYDFWIPEMDFKYISDLKEDPTRYFVELNHKFQDPIKVGLYVLAFIALALHLLHGFQSSFQSVGFNNNKYTPAIKILGNIFAIAVPLGFTIVAIYHFLNPLHQ
jgi:succinate dehydrogenase / fumarate reductase cytochrome b subunit